MSHGGTTLLKTRLLSNENIVAEFVEEPVGCCWTSGFIRHVQLTTHRINYSEVYKKNCCFTTPPTLRQVFLKEISEIAVDNYRRVDESWAKQLLNFVLHVGFPLGGAALIVYGVFFYEPSVMYTIIGSVLLAVGLVTIIVWLCRKKAPQIIFGTRCPQLPAFAITLASASDRMRLLEEVSALLAKHQ